MPFKIIIIGGGLTGSLLALGLIRNDIDVQVYERSEPHSTREGLQIRLTAPALQGMRTCLTQEHLMAIVKKFGPASEAKAEAPRVFHKDGSVLIDLSKFPAYGKNAPINRGLLRDLMADPVFDAGKLKYNLAFDRYEVLNPGMDNERIRVWLADGSHDDCDLLIGADGSYTKVNKQIGLNSIDYIPRHVAITAKCDLPTSRFLKMSKELVGGPVMTWADKKSFFFGVYLPKKDEQDGSSAAAKPSGQKSYDEGLSSCMISLNVERHLLPEDLDKQSLDAQYDFMAKSIESWSPMFQEMVEVMRGAPLHIYRPRTAKKPAKEWRKKVQNKDKPELGHPRVWVIGDAMHAMLPPRGMGGNMAMLDAGEVLPFLVDLAAKDKLDKRVSNAEIEKALYVFENKMITRSFDWVKKSGGDNFVPLDTSTISGRLFFILMGQWLNLVCFWTKVTQLFSNKPLEDKTPEFNMLL
ncbi:hypothetical protein EDB81DRAFT_821893 [Dactylonectria macrodidyma]|uniref:FAD-binding domain-containing protein n=1 Tax=Dactylonectria macrodidyma TaxID=307937 RepID=A0A9P9CX45_9HYPO|nr:hypothetical protein EDB81DRAFT_834127 [Dactylonectria macrodidyma]KAH7114908.1 hypothetical protein EDB81DRAFT_821893 [Dactylonectria macrodidyma]